MSLCVQILVPLATLVAAVTGGEQAKLNQFESDVRPLLINHCIECHGPEKQKGGLRLDSRDGWATGGGRGPALIPGQVDDSLLIQAIRGSDPDLQMPPDAPLAPEEIAALEEWVANGAPDPRQGSGPQPVRKKSDIETFWSFQPIGNPAPPEVDEQDWVQTPVDAFILAKLGELGMTHAPRADARTLVRRAYFDLIGLPPTPEQVDDFAKDPSQERWAQLIDTLLASPQYGERWGRHWLDVARYADSGGFETDIYYKNAWRYRDYVVKSFNDDKPFDIFVQEQIAGDELWPGNIDQEGQYAVDAEKLRRQEARIGTGFYTLSPQIHESNMNGDRIRYETFTDWVDTTGAAFMGLTLGCARCHDHKFDPVSQEDYYRLQAIFAGSRQVQESVVPPMSVADYGQHYPRVIAADEARKAVRLFDVKVNGRDLTEEEKGERQALLLKLAESVLELQEKSAQGESFDGLYDLPTASVLGREDPALVPAIHVLSRGELSQAGPEVAPGLPKAFQQATGWAEPVPGPYGARTALAQWLTSPTHPLTARVMANRIWYGHFGRGIVASLNDFGLMGERPSHPELLDWLATEFRSGGWSIKHLHRVIMLSSTYQMESVWQNEANHAADPANHYLWKMNRRRLEAEALWDAIHAVAGTLNLKAGGRPVVPPLEADEGAPKYWTVSADPADHTRRGIYILQRRNFRFPMFDVFDLPVNAVSAPARDTTTVAPQALWLMNNATALRQAEAFAKRLIGDADAGWNKADFGPGQPGWEGNKAGPHAGWAKRVDNGNPTEGFDDPIGAVLTHGPTSVTWKVPADPATSNTLSIQIQGGLWNVRHLNRSGTWTLQHNDITIVEGQLNDTSGASAVPQPIGPLTIEAIPGDTFRLEVLEDDFVGVTLQIATPTQIRDLAADFTLSANPTSTGWQYSEAKSNGATALTHAIHAQTESTPSSFVSRAWRLATGRPPTNEEATEALALMAATAPDDIQQGLTQLCLAIFNLQEFLYVD